MANHVVLIDQGSPAPDFEGRPPVRGITLYWDSWDGERYDLTDVAGGIYVVQDGLEGLGYPEITNYKNTSPMLHGSMWAGWLAETRKVYWNVAVYHGDGGQKWVDKAQGFLRSFRPGTTGRWTVELPGGAQYGLTLRYKSGLNGSRDVDPTRRGWHIYGIELEPEQVFFEGPEERIIWNSGSDVNFFGPTGFGPPFFIGTSQKMEKATITNPGDVEAYATWELVGPFDSASFGLAGRVTPITFAVPNGQTLILDTNPRSGLTAYLNGVDVMDRIPGFQYPPIPPGEATPVTLTMDGTGTIRARFRPLHLGLI